MEEAKKQMKAKAKASKGAKKHKNKAKAKEMVESNTEASKKIKEAFRSNMAGVMVNILNAYRKPDCKLGRIQNTEDFKHLARKVRLNSLVLVLLTQHFSVDAFCNAERN